MPLLPPVRATLLDVATGSADIPAGVKSHAARRGIEVQATGLDLSDDVLLEAHSVAGESVSLVRGDARRLPFPDAGFDVVMMCLALHHFDQPDAALVLKEMWRVARVAVAVVDLRRSVAAYAGVWLLTRTLARSRLTRHDGPLSVLRAYTEPEVSQIARAAGLRNATVVRHGPARLTLVALKDAPRR
jgi:ubiquinone/menaquinone biosynthesis C-methylase UbiE